MLIPKENIIAFSEDFKLSINLRRTIIIDFIIVELLGICPVIFPSNRKGFLRKSLCLVLILYFRIPLVSGIRFYSQKEFLL